MKTAKQLHEERLVPCNRMQEILKGAQDENRAMTGEEQAEFDTCDEAQQRLHKMSEEARALELASAHEPPDDPIPPDGGENRDLIPGRGTDGATLTPEMEFRAFRTWMVGGHGCSRSACEEASRIGFDPATKSITIDLRKCRTRPDGKAPRNVYEARALQSKMREEHRAQSVGVAADGGNFVADEAMAAVDIALLSFGGMRQAATVITTGTGADMPFPTSDDTTNTGALISEGLEDTEQDIAMGQTVLQSYMYTSNIVKASLEFIQDVSVNAAAFIGEMLGTRIGRIQNDHFTTGTGTSQPNGIVTAAADSGVTAASTTAVTFTEIMNLLHSVDPAYRPMSSFMVHDTLLKLMKLMTTEPNQNRPLWLPGINVGDPDTFNGYSVFVNQSLTAPASGAKSGIFGQLTKYIIRDAQSLELIRLSERYAEKRQVGFVAIMRSDGDLIDAGTNPVKWMDHT